MNLGSIKHVHFIGVGGIGISALAKMFLLEGKTVSGSDMSESQITSDLAHDGAHIFISHSKENIPPNTQLVIYTIAVSDKNEELLHARASGITCLSYPEALGLISRDKTTIAISGTHGKTTTTAMIAHLMLELQMAPTVIVGSKLADKQSNFIAGKSEYLVVEACEYHRSFLNLHPTFLVITNIEEDHLDYYKDLDDIKSAFFELASRIPPHGAIITNTETKEWLESAGIKAPIYDYENVNAVPKLLTPGKHNQANARAAIQTVSLIHKGEISHHLATFKGTWRRLEYKDRKQNRIYFDDYAHHPTEIRSSLLALKQEYPERKIICVFEPHQQSRTKALFEGFVEALQIADNCFIAPILCVREQYDPEITNEKLSKAVIKFVPSKPVETPEELMGEMKKLDTTLEYCVVIMGAGNIYKWTEIIMK